MAASPDEAIGCGSQKSVRQLRIAEPGTQTNFAPQQIVRQPDAEDHRRIHRLDYCAAVYASTGRGSQFGNRRIEPDLAIRNPHSRFPAVDCLHNPRWFVETVGRQETDATASAESFWHDPQRPQDGIS